MTGTLVRPKSIDLVAKSEAIVLVPGYVSMHDSALVVHDDCDTATAHGVVEAMGELLEVFKAEDVQYDARLPGHNEVALLDLVELNGTCYLAPVDVAFELTTVQKATAVEKRYTFGVVYKATNVEDDPDLDLHDEFALVNDLQGAQWDYVRKGNRNIYLQHGDAANVIGESVDIVTWPFEVETEFLHKGKTKTEIIPANSVWMGVVWTEDAWPVVKSGEIGGLSMGGWAKRLKR